VIDGQIRASPDVGIVRFERNAGRQRHVWVGYEEDVYAGSGHVTAQKIRVHVVRVSDVGSIKVLTATSGIAIEDADR
jgi:hypothetical protein